MRALILADIHSNLEALEAVLTAAPPYDQVWNLGDIVGYGRNPNEVTERVRNLGGIVVRGNHDRACTGNMHFEDFRKLNREALASAQWTQEVLNRKNAEWLSSLKRGPIRPIVRKVACVHGAMWHEDRYLFFREDVTADFCMTRTKIVFHGHTHWQTGWSWYRGNLDPIKPEYASGTGPVSFDLPLDIHRRYILNPGSVGQPRDGDLRAAFALYDDAQSLLTWWRVPYQ